MFEILTQTTETCLVGHFSGKVAGEDYQQFLNAVDERLKTHGKVNLVVELINPLTKVEEKHFAVNQLALACEWAC